MTNVRQQTCPLYIVFWKEIGCQHIEGTSGCFCQSIFDPSVPPPHPILPEHIACEVNEQKG